MVIVGPGDLHFWPFYIAVLRDFSYSDYLITVDVIRIVVYYFKI